MITSIVTEGSSLLRFHGGVWSIFAKRLAIGRSGRIHTLLRTGTPRTGKRAASTDGEERSIVAVIVWREWTSSP